VPILRSSRSLPWWRRRLPYLPLLSAFHARGGRMALRPT
jgi:hypothetical protein